MYSASSRTAILSTLILLVTSSSIIAAQTQSNITGIRPLQASSTGHLRIQQSTPSAATALTADFGYPTPASAGSPVTVTASVSGGTPPYSFSWDDGSGTTSTVNPAVFIYTSPGAYTVNLKVTDAAGESVTVSHSLSVGPGDRVLDFVITAAYQGSPVAFSGTTEGTGGYSFQWDYGDGSPPTYLYGTALEVSHAYSNAGTFVVELRAINGGGGTSYQASRPVVVQPSLITADFNWPSLVTNRSATVLNATVYGGTPPFSFSWDTGATSALTGSPVTYTYVNPGTYVVVLTVKDSSDTKVVAAKPLTVQSFLKALDFSSTPAYLGSPVAFSGTSHGPGGYAFQWDFGDGTSTYLYGTSLQSSHVYSSPGTYFVLLKANNGGGVTDGEAAHAVILKTSPVKVDFSWPSLVTNRSSVVLTATVSGGASPYTFKWDNNDTSTATENPATFTYNNTGTYIVILKVTDNAGNTAVAGRPLTVAPFLKTLGFTTTTATAGSPVSFSGTAIGPGGYDYQWDFGDGTSTYLYNTDLQVSHTYSTGGTYIVLLKAINGGGVADGEASHALFVHATPVTAGIVWPIPATNNSYVTFTAIASGGTPPYNFAWTNGAGATAMGNYPEFIYTTIGTYIVTLTVTDNAGNNATAARPVIVAAAQKAVSFTWTTPPIPGIPVNFTGMFVGAGGYSVQWDFGDGSPPTYPYGTDLNPTHTYATAGIYVVQLRAIDGGGNIRAVASHAVSVQALSNQPPTVSFFTVGPATLYRSDALTITIIVSDPDGTITSITVDWGDGALHTLAGTATTDSHSYSTLGTFTITVTATDNGTPGLNASASLTFTVHDKPPVAAFTANPSTVPTGTQVTFDATNSHDPDGTILSYNWDFGDNTHDTGATVAHTYTTAKSYTVKLTVTDNDGSTNSTSVSYIVGDRPPTAKITFSPTNPLTRVPITFDSSTSSDSDGTIVSQAWEFGDGATAIGITANHSYPASGTYTVKLTVTDNSGNTGSTSITITIADRPPVASFTVSASNPTVGQTVTFDGRSSSDPDGMIAGYSWRFGDSGTGSGSTVTHAYSSVGSTNVSLTVTDNNGSTASYSITLTVSPAHGQVKCGEKEDTCSVQSNSTITNADADRNKISLTVTGAKGTVGWANVTLPKSTVPDIKRLRVTVDGVRVPSSEITITMNATDYFVYLTFSFHSPVNIEISYNPPPDTIFGLDPTFYYLSLAGLTAGVVAVVGGLIIRKRSVQAHRQILK